MYPFIRILGHDIGTYGLMAMLAAIICGAILMMLLKKVKIVFEDFVFFLLFALAGLVLGSHLLYAVTQYRYIPFLFQKATFSVWWARAQYIFGGSVFYGGLLGGTLTGYLGLRFLKQDVSTYSDLMAPIVPLFHAIARVGCFLAGCCYGIPCAWGIAVTGNTMVPGINGVHRFPVQLLEAACNLALAGVLFLVWQRRHRYPLVCGNLYKIYLISYGIIRFFDEFLRGDTYRGIWGPFSTSQWISIFTVSISSALLIRSIVRKKTIKNG